MIAAVSLNSCLDRTLRAEDFAPGRHCRAELLSLLPAGKGVNVALMLARLGERAELFGFTGRDSVADFAARAEKFGVKNRLRAVTARTRMNTTLIGAGADIHLREGGEPVEPSRFGELLAELQAATMPGTWVAFCGSLPPGLSPEAFASGVGELAAAGRRVAVDCAGAALRLALEAGAALAKPNREEFAWLCGANSVEFDLAASAAAYCRGRENLRLLVSDGERGACLADAAGYVRARLSEPLRPYSTVGAGDALLAGFLSGETRGMPAPEALTLALRAAGAWLLAGGPEEAELAKTTEWRVIFD